MIKRIQWINCSSDNEVKIKQAISCGHKINSINVEYFKAQADAILFTVHTLNKCVVVQNVHNVILPSQQKLRLAQINTVR